MAGPAPRHAHNPECRICRKPMTVGQRAAHAACIDANLSPAAIREAFPHASLPASKRATTPPTKEQP